jgi:broad specificity phosphatase PhoE
MPTLFAVVCREFGLGSWSRPPQVIRLREMTFELLFCGLLVLAIPEAIFAEPSYDGHSSALNNAVILIIRHAEQADHGYGLSSVGDARATAYVNYFKTFTVDGKPLKLDYLFAAKDSRTSHRPRLTIEPIGKELGLTVDSRFDNQHFLDLAHEIQSRPHGSNILICWHHATIPQLLRALGADPKHLLPKGKWPDDVFGWVIQLRYDEKGHLTESKRIDEHVLPDDSGKHVGLRPHKSLLAGRGGID